MAIPGTLSIHRAGGPTLVKALCGCGGENIAALAYMALACPPPTRDSVYEAALTIGFGCRDCLVVMDAGTMRFAGTLTDPTPYRAAFADPLANPHWAPGKPGRAVVVYLDGDTFDGH